MPSQEFKNQLLRMKQSDRNRLKQEQAFAIDYLKNRQVADVENELLHRFQQSQIGSAGQEIQPCVVPLTERYVSEMATLYNKPVRRYFVDSSGKETDTTKRLSEELTNALYEIGYDEIMQANDRLTLLLSTSCVWYQIHKDALRPVIVYPYCVHPVAPNGEDSVEFDKADPKDYAAFIVETDCDQEDAYAARGMVYTYLDKETRKTYTGHGPESPDKIIEESPHGFSSNPLTFWQKSAGNDELIVYSDCLIARANREINIAWSVLLDVLRFQSYATPVKKLINKGETNAFQPHGVRFPVVLQAGGEEDFTYASAMTPYTETSNTLREFSQLLALSMRQNPEDFSTSSVQAISGFSKMVSNLPKIEAREERINHVRRQEEYVAGPLIVDGLIKTGKLSSSAKSYQMRVEFSKVEYPQTAQEEALTTQTDITYGLTTPAKILAKRKGISIEEAEIQIEENMARNKELGVTQQKRQEFSFGEIIGGRQKKNGNSR